MMTEHLQTGRSHRWFREIFSIDYRSLAAFRISLAVLILVDLATRAPYIAANYTKAGVFPHQALSRWDFHLSLRFLGDSYEFHAALFCIASVAAVMLLVGWQTRIATIVSWLLLCSLHSRNEFLNNGGDDLFRALLLWSMFLPLGKKWSLDARANPLHLPEGKTILSAGTVAILLQFLYLYLATGLGKSTAQWHSEGTAVQLALGQEELLQPIGRWLRQFPGLLRFLTPTVYYFEVIAPLLLFVPFRRTGIRLCVIASFWCLQIGLRSCLDTCLFPWTSTIATLPFLPVAFWDWFAKSSTPASDESAAATASEPSADNTDQIATRKSWPSRIELSCVSVLIGLVTVSSIHFARTGRQDPIPKHGHSLGLINAWHMYTDINEHSVTFKIDAQLKDGSQVDLLKPAGKAPWEAVVDIHDSVRFKLYVRTMSNKKGYSRSYIRWLFQAWNESHTNAQRITVLRRFFESTQILPPGEPRVTLIEVVQTVDGKSRHRRLWKPWEQGS